MENASPLRKAAPSRGNRIYSPLRDATNLSSEHSKSRYSLRSKGGISTEAFNELLGASHVQPRKQSSSSSIPRKKVTIVLDDDHCGQGVLNDVTTMNNIAAGVLLIGKMDEVVSVKSRANLVRAFAHWTAYSQSSKNTDNDFNSPFEYSYTPSSRAAAKFVKEDIYENEPDSPVTYISTPSRVRGASSSSSPKKAESTPKKRKLEGEQVRAAGVTPSRNATEVEPSPFLMESTPKYSNSSSSAPFSSSQSEGKDVFIDSLADKINNIGISELAEETSSSSTASNGGGRADMAPFIVSLPLQSDFYALHESMVEATSAAIGHLLQHHRVRKDTSRSDSKQLLDREFQSMGSATKKIFDFNTIATLNDKSVREEVFVPFGAQGMERLPGGERPPVKAGTYSFVPLCELPLLRDKIGSWREKYGHIREGREQNPAPAPAAADKENDPLEKSGNFLRPTDFQHTSLL